jgi:hypothetical protein
MRTTPMTHTPSSKPELGPVVCKKYSASLSTRLVALTNTLLVRLPATSLSSSALPPPCGSLVIPLCRNLQFDDTCGFPRCPGGLYRGSIAQVWLRPEFFPGIQPGVLPGPVTGSHTVNRGTSVAPLGHPQLNVQENKRGLPWEARHGTFIFTTLQVVCIYFDIPRISAAGSNLFNITYYGVSKRDLTKCRAEISQVIFARKLKKKSK